MKKEADIVDIRTFLENDKVQEILSFFDINLDPSQSDDQLMKDYLRAIQELPPQYAKGLKNLDVNFVEHSNALEQKIAKSLNSEKLSIVQKDNIIKTCLKEYNRGLSPLFEICNNLSMAVLDYKEDHRSPLEKEDKKEKIQAINKQLADIWTSTVEISTRHAIREFKRLTNNIDNPEIEELKDIVSANFKIDEKITQPMRAYSSIVEEYENALRIQKDIEYQNTRSHENSNNHFSPR